MKNLWRSWDAVDPVVGWQIELPLARPDQRFHWLEALARAGDESGLFTLQQVELPGLPFHIRGAVDNQPWVAAASQHGLAEIFPFESYFLDQRAGGAALSVLSTVSYARPDGAVATERHADAGALLRALDPGCEPLLAERFQAHQPFVALWSATSARLLRVSFGFWCDIWFDAAEPALLRLNGERLEKLRGRLRGIAESAGGRCDLPAAR